MNNFNQTIIHAKKKFDLEFCIYHLNYLKVSNIYDKTCLLPLIDGYKKVKKYNYDLDNNQLAAISVYKKVKYRYDFTNNKLNFDVLN